MVIQVTIGYCLFLIIVIAFIIYYRNMGKKDDVRAIMSGSTNDPSKLSDKESYSIYDINKNKRDKSGIQNMVKGVIFGTSLEPLGINCGDGASIQPFSDEQKKNIKENHLIEKNDIILFNYSRKKIDAIHPIGIKSRRFIAFLDLSKPVDEIQKNILDYTPKDSGLKEWERVNDNTIDDGTKDSLMKRIENITVKLKEAYGENTDDYKENASNHILSLTYLLDENDNYYARYSVHSIDKLFGKAAYIISKDSIDSEVIIKEYNLKSQNKTA